MPQAIGLLPTANRRGAEAQRTRRGDCRSLHGWESARCGGERVIAPVSTAPLADQRRGSASSREGRRALPRVGRVCVGLLAASRVAPCVARARACLAQSFPDRPLKLVVGFAPGGPADALARIAAQILSEGLGQPVIVENRPGAGGTIAAATVAKATPDGYTLLVGATSDVINPLANKEVQYNIETSFTPIALIASAPNVLVVHPSVPVASVQELVEYARAHPGSAQLRLRRRRHDQPSRRGVRRRDGASCRSCTYPTRAPRRRRSTCSAAGCSSCSTAWSSASANAKAGKVKALAVTSPAALADRAGAADHGRERVRGLRHDRLVRLAGAGGHARARRFPHLRCPAEGSAEQRRAPAYRRDRRRARSLHAGRVRRSISAPRTRAGRRSSPTGWCASRNESFRRKPSCRPTHTQRASSPTTTPIRSTSSRSCTRWRPAASRWTGLTEEILKDHDQDHFGGIEANDLLIAKARHRAAITSCWTCAAGWAVRHATSRSASAAGWSGLDFTESRHLARTAPDQAGRTWTTWSASGTAMRWTCRSTMRASTR